MINRRQFVYVAASAAAMLTRTTHTFATSYDLIIKGGRVIDPSVRLNATRDVAITGGRIEAVETDITGDATEIIDATGKLVIPGLLDVHSHYARDTEGPRICLSDGVTGWVDAGSEGADQIDDMVEIAEAEAAIFLLDGDAVKAEFAHGGPEVAGEPVLGIDLRRQRGDMIGGETGGVAGHARKMHQEVQGHPLGR